MLLHWYQRYKALEKCRQGQLPPELCEYLGLFGRQAAKREPVENIRFVVFDTETTGLDMEQDSIISIGAVVVEANRLVFSQSLEEIIRQGSSGGQESVPIHQMLNSDLKAGSAEAEVLLRWLSFAGNAVLVGHHVDFDIGMLNKAMQRYWGVSLQNQKLDTGALARRLEQSVVNTLHDSKPQSLDTLCERFRINVSFRHNAAGDALATATVLLYLLKRAKERGITTRGELLR
jgi:DNA polymerase-3 subunit epsilon